MKGVGQGGRVFVGLDGSLASLRALRRGVAEARLRTAALHAVHVRPQVRPKGHQAGLVGVALEEQRLGQWLDGQAEGLIARCFDDGLGAVPTDVEVYTRVPVGPPGRALVNLAWRDDDLIVVGTGEHRWLHRLLGGSVSRYCLDHADCPVLLVPPDRFARVMHRRTWLGGSPLGRDLWERFEAASTSGGRRTR